MNFTKNFMLTTIFILSFMNTSVYAKSDEKIATINQALISIHGGEVITIPSYLVEGYNYVRIAELGKAMDFQVGYSTMYADKDGETSFIVPTLQIEMPYSKKFTNEFPILTKNNIKVKIEPILVYCSLFGKEIEGFNLDDRNYFKLQDIAQLSVQAKENTKELIVKNRLATFEVNYDYSRKIINVEFSNEKPIVDKSITTNIPKIPATENISKNNNENIQIPSESILETQNNQIESSNSAKDNINYITDNINYITDNINYITDNIDYSNLKFNTDHITLYALNKSLYNTITIPSSYPTSFKLELVGATNVKWSTPYNNSVEINEEGIVSTVKNDNLSYGDTVITADVNGHKFNITATVVEYGSIYVENVIHNYLDNNITDNMTEMEKVIKICEFVSSYDYNGFNPTLRMMIMGDGGDCWASTEAINYMCNKLGIKSIVRDAKNDKGAASGHINNLVEIDGKNYIVDAGYSGKAPRYYSIVLAK